MKPVRTVEVQVIELDAVEDAARRERVQGAFLGFNVGVTVMLFGVGLVRGELLVLLPALALGVVGFVGFLLGFRAARRTRLELQARWRGRAEG